MNNSKKPPQDIKYKRAIYIDKIWNLLFLVSIIIALIQNLYLRNNDVIFLEINAIILIVLFSLEYLREKNIYEGAILKRKNLFDTTFGLNRICDKVDEFYDNEDIDDEMIKLFANNHESLLFTKVITSKMLIYHYILIGFIVMLFVVSVFRSGLTETNFITMGTMLSYFGIGRTLDIKSVNNLSNLLFDESSRIANDMDIGISKTNFAEMIEVIINYEALLSSMNFVLSGYVYSKKGQSLTEKWLEIKKNYKVYNEGFYEDED